MRQEGCVGNVPNRTTQEDQEVSGLMVIQNTRPVVKGVSYFLAHVPSMVRHGSKPSREIGKDPSLLTPVLGHLWTFNDAVAYPPNQVFIGNLDPDDLLHTIPSP